MFNYRFIVVSSRAPSIAQERSQNDRRRLPVCATFPFIYAVQYVVATLFDERGRVVLS